MVLVAVLSSWYATLERLEGERVAEVVIQGQELYITDTNRQRFKIYSPQDPDLIPTLRERGVTISAKPPAESPWYMNILVSWFPMIVLIGVWIFFMRQMQSGSGRAMGFGKSKAKLLTEAHGRVTFNDVAGVDEAKEDLEAASGKMSSAQKELAGQSYKRAGKAQTGALEDLQQAFHISSRQFPELFS